MEHEPANNEDKPTTVAPAKPKLKRGRRPNPNPAPRGYMRRLAEELAAEGAARQEARRADPNYRPPSTMFTRPPVVPYAECLEQMKLTPAQKAYRRSKVLQAEREAKAERDAALLAFVHEQRARREALEKAAAERKAAGVKISFEDWRREALGEE